MIFSLTRHTPFSRASTTILDSCRRPSALPWISSRTHTRTVARDSSGSMVAHTDVGRFLPAFLKDGGDRSRTR